MSESAVQIPDFIQTAMGGKRIARRARKMSLVQHIFGFFLGFGLEFYLRGVGWGGWVGEVEMGRG